MKYVLITGTNRGIGLGLVKTLTKIKEPPKKILATCRRPAEAQELQQLAKEHNNVSIIPFDVTDFGSYDKLVKQVSQEVKGNGLNLLVNNAGVPGKFARFSYFKAEHMIDTFTVNTVAPIILTKALLPVLKEASDSNKSLSIGSSRAAVVNMSSVLGSITQNDSGGHYAYRCSKSALNAATKSLSIDLSSFGILVMSLHPGWVKTDMGGYKAPITVEQSTEQIVQLLCSLSEKHNGQFYNYDGTQLPW